MQLQSYLQNTRLSFDRMSSEKIEKYIKKAFPEHWFDYARELKDASMELWQSHKNVYIAYSTYEEGDFFRKLYSRTYFLLMGLAIENLLKGILISENPEYILDGKIDKEISSGHNLEALLKKVGSINFMDREIEICRTLSQLIPYWGKYPIPKNFSMLKNELFMTEEWFEELLKLYTKLEFKLCELNINGIKGPNNIDFPRLFVEGVSDKVKI